MHDGIYGNGGGGQGPPSVGSGRQSYTHQGSFFVLFVVFWAVHPILTSFLVVLGDEVTKICDEPGIWNKNVYLQQVFCLFYYPKLNGTYIKKVKEIHKF